MTILNIINEIIYLFTQENYTIEKEKTYIIIHFSSGLDIAVSGTTTADTLRNLIDKLEANFHDN